MGYTALQGPAVIQKGTSNDQIQKSLAFHYVRSIPDYRVKRVGTQRDPLNLGNLTVIRRRHQFFG